MLSGGRHNRFGGVLDISKQTNRYKVQTPKRLAQLLEFLVRSVSAAEILTEYLPCSSIGRFAAGSVVRFFQSAQPGICPFKICIK
jgi:hypothetical protein